MREKLVGLEVQIPLADRVKLPAAAITSGIWWDARCAKRWARRSGVVRDVEIHGRDFGTPNLVVDTPRGELLIPLAQEICVNVDFAARRLRWCSPKDSAN